MLLEEKQKLRNDREAALDEQKKRLVIDQLNEVDYKIPTLADAALTLFSASRAVTL